jgi:hypothetical protein
VKRLPRFRHHSLHSPGRRLGNAWRRLVGKRFLSPKRVRRLTIDGRDFKRVTFADASVAAAVARNLGRFRHADVFPKLVAAQGRELLLEFVPGQTPEAPFDDACVDRLAEFFSVLYAVDRRRVPTPETHAVEDLQRDLAFLRDVAVLTPAAQRDLAVAAAGLAPEAVWIGWDHLDPLPRNFVATRDGRLVAVDVEDLQPDELLGSGLAKSFLRTVGSRRERLLTAVERAAAIDLAPQLPFVELHFLARWTLQATLKGRARLVDPGHFERFREK